MDQALKPTSLDPESDIAKDIRVAAYQGEDRIVHFTEYIQDRMEKTKHLKVFGSDFPSFDEHLGGLMTSEVTVISGFTGEGKTLFAESWIRGLLSHNAGMKACVFSYEVAPEMMMEKYVDDPFTPIYLPMSLKLMDPKWLIERVREAKVKYGCEIVLIDHLHFLVDMSAKQNMSLNVGAFMRILKQEIAVKLNVAPILIAHQEKKDTMRNSGEPSIDTIRDSSFIGQEADNVLCVWRRPDFLEPEIAAITLYPNPFCFKIPLRLRGRIAVYSSMPIIYNPYGPKCLVWVFSPFLVATYICSLHCVCVGVYFGCEKE